MKKFHTIVSRQKFQMGEISRVEVDNRTGQINFESEDGLEQKTTGPIELSDEDRRLVRSKKGFD